MALNIKDPDTDRLARELAHLTGESITVAARVALEERLRRLRAKARVTSAGADLQAIIERGRRRPVVDGRSAEDILGYDERGLPV